jgi:5-methyltetrahydropteroyltriglutamate--homocysteine methyltransferase
VEPHFGKSAPCWVGRIQVNPDCGVRTRCWEVVYEKLAKMVKGARLAEEALG